MGLDRGQWKTNPTLDICHLVKIATTLLVAIELNRGNIEFFYGLRTWEYRLPPVN